MLNKKIILNNVENLSNSDLELLRLYSIPKNYLLLQEHIDHYNEKLEILLDGINDPEVTESYIKAKTSVELYNWHENICKFVEINI